MVFLPWELINEILLKLPLKSVVRFRCVCKSWLSLISDPYFAMSHFERATAAREERIVFFSLSIDEFRSINCNASLHDDSAYSLLNSNFLLHYPLAILILGSCRGFILLMARDILGFFVWNPFTGVHKGIPLSPIASHSPVEFFPFLYGFGYDPSTDDYLMVQVSYSYNPRPATRMQFFSLRTNAWKEIEEATNLCYKYYSCHSLNTIGCLLNGAIHWLAFNYDVSMNVILVFDLTERSFSEILLPVDFEYKSCVLRVLGNLCAVGKNKHSVEIWVMKEYKVQSSWTKTVVISLDDIPIQDFFPICSVPV